MEEKQPIKINLRLVVAHKPTWEELSILARRIGEWSREFCLELRSFESDLGEKND